jgi:hypothetical protein
MMVKFSVLRTFDIFGAPVLHATVAAMAEGPARRSVGEGGDENEFGAATDDARLDEAGGLRGVPGVEPVFRGVRGRSTAAGGARTV